MQTFQNYIGGTWHDAASGETFEDRNPARQSDLIGRFPKSGAEDVDRAVQAAHRVLQEGSQYFAEGAVITDTASTKADVMRWAGEFLPDGVHFIGGHPMAGKEHSGLEHADPDLFEGRPWLLVAANQEHDRV